MINNNINESEQNNNKPSYDARQHFSRFLVELRVEIARSTNDINAWMDNLLKLASNCAGLVDNNKLKEWHKHQQEITKRYNCKYIINQQNYKSNGNSINVEQSFKGVMFKLQSELYEITAPLFLPISAGDDLVNYDPSVFLDK